MKMKRITFSLLLGILLTAIIAAPVLAGYYASLTVTEANGNAYSQVGLIEDVDVTYLADNGYISPTGLDTRVTSGGTAIPHLMVDDSILFSTALAAYETSNLQFTTENTVLSAFDIVVGDGGYVTVSDHANLELGNDFEIEFDGYIDTSSADDLLAKTGAFTLVSTGTGDVLATIYRPTDIDNTDAGTVFDLHSGDDTMAGIRVNVMPAGLIEQVSFYLQKYGNPTGTAYARARRVSDDGLVGTFGSIDVSTLTTSWVYYDFTDGVTIPSNQDVRILIEYDGGGSNDRIELRRDDNGGVANSQFTKYNGVTWTDYADDDCCIKVQYSNDVELTATVSSGEAKITVNNDGSNLKLYVDDVEEDSATSAGAIDTANDLVIANIPYYDYYTHTISSTLRITYQPDSIISGTTLPNEESPGTYDGTITWGSNPGGVTVTLGGLISDEQLLPAGSGADFPEPQDIAGPSGQPGMTADVAALTTNPLYPVVSMISDTTSLPVGIVWVMGATFILALLFVWMIGDQQMMHQMFIGLAGGGWVAFCWHLGIYPFWVIFIYAVLAIAIVVGERSPTIS